MWMYTCVDDAIFYIHYMYSLPYILSLCLASSEQTPAAYDVTYLGDVTYYSFDEDSESYSTTDDDTFDDDFTSRPETPEEFYDDGYHTLVLSPPWTWVSGHWDQPLLFM